MSGRRIDVSRAAELIRSGGLVAFPTETVYGLGANALDARAVERIFAAKRRPHTSPLIVHVDTIEMARSLAREWPAAADALAARFWPGPLTLIVPKRPHVPDIVTAGLDTVGIRMPRHELALAIIRAAATPIAAPSANRFTELSPTEAEHVEESLGEDLDGVVAGGASEVGIESTVLSLAGPPALLRPGVIPLPEIEALIGPVTVVTGSPDGPHPAPGMHLRHYSPHTPLHLGAAPAAGRGAWLRIEGRCARDFASALYARLHELDHAGLDWIAVELPPDTPEWAGVLDRLRRAAKR
jgi:L-threonylcarbamoyladenylate synthase